MSDSTTATGEQPFDLTPAAIAILEFTSDDQGAIKKLGSFPCITSKGAYLWAGVASALAEMAEEGINDHPPRRFENIEISAAMYCAVEAQRDALRSIYSTLPQLKIISDDNSDVRRSRRKQGNHLFRIDDLPKKEEEGTSRLIFDFLSELWQYPEDLATIANKINSNIKSGYTDLINDKLIDDPILGGLEYAILSIIPFSYTRRTRQGRLEYLKIRAATWEYERVRTANATIDTKLEAGRLAKKIKKILISALDELVKGQDDGNDEPPTATVT